MGVYSNYIFPFLLDRFMDHPQLTKRRRQILAKARGEILEIGLGTGLNLPHYPQHVTTVTSVDPNPGMSRYLRKRLNDSHVTLDQHLLSGENLPFNDEHFDTVVCTWTMCSIPKVEQALSEVHRVLKPGGQFLFIEHGLSHEHHVARLQHALTPLQRVVADGCHLNRNIESLVQQAGFSEVHVEKYYMQRVPKFGGFMYEGYAKR